MDILALVSVSSGSLSQQSHTAYQHLGQLVPDLLGALGQPMPAHPPGREPAGDREQPPGDIHL